MERQAVKKLYTENASFYHRLFVNYLLYGKGLKAALRKHVGLRPGMKVLDAGCGTGILMRNLYEIARENGLQEIEFHGLDLTPAMMDLFKVWISDRRATGITLQQADVLKPEQLPQAWRNHDVVVSSGMLEYLSKDEIVDALRNLNGLLGEDGTMMVFITRHNILNKWLIQAWWKGNMYKRDEISRVFHDAGLSMEFKRFPFPYRHLNLWGFVMLAKKKAG